MAEALSLVTVSNSEHKTPRKIIFIPTKIERHIAYIDARLQEYSTALAKEDGDVLEKQIIEKKIKKHIIQNQKYN